MTKSSLFKKYIDKGKVDHKLLEDDIALDEELINEFNKRRKMNA